jgi:general secretion pathway protein G
MALVFCTRCGHRVSTTAPKCPSCGTPPYSGRVASTASADAPANAPTAALASRESAAPPIGLEQPSVLTLRIAKPQMRIAAAIVAITLVGWWISYVPNTPSYAIYEFYEAAAAHDGAAAVSYFDFDSIASRMTDDMEAESLKDESGEESLGGIVGGAVLGMMSKQIVGTIRSRFEQRIDNLSPDDMQKTRELAFEAAWNIRRTGRVAHTRLTDSQGKRLDVTLKYNADNGWRVTEVGGPSVREITAKAVEQVVPGAADKAKRTKAHADLAEIKTALDRYYHDNGYYPTGDQGLQALVSPPTKDDRGTAAEQHLRALLSPPTNGRVPAKFVRYIERVPTDPWGDPYYYWSDGENYVLKSFGATREVSRGGMDSSDDIDAGQP